MGTRPPAKLLYIADLIRRMSDMERGRAEMEPLSYRVLARQLRQAAAGFSDEALVHAFGSADPHIRDLLENRHFAEHGSLPGAGSRACLAQTRAVFAGLGVRLPVAGPPPL